MQRSGVEVRVCDYLLRPPLCIGDGVGGNSLSLRNLGRSGTVGLFTAGLRHSGGGSNQATGLAACRLKNVLCPQIGQKVGYPRFLAGLPLLGSLAVISGIIIDLPPPRSRRKQFAPQTRYSPPRRLSTASVNCAQRKIDTGTVRAACLFVRRVGMLRRNLDYHAGDRSDRGRENAINSADEPLQHPETEKENKRRQVERRPPDPHGRQDAPQRL